MKSLSELLTWPLSFVTLTVGLVTAVQARRARSVVAEPLMLMRADEPLTVMSSVLRKSGGDGELRSGPVNPVQAEPGTVARSADSANCQMFEHVREGL